MPLSNESILKTPSSEPTNVSSVGTGIWDTADGNGGKSAAEPVLQKGCFRTPFNSLNPGHRLKPFFLSHKVWLSRT